ncbi:MAG: penicillin-binding protein 2, partial [Proteobacteria bacterium]|nr:penicillin-binding protein 2 [Pseudomonadota bacterium]
AVLVENGGFGAQSAAPIARQVIDYYLLDQRAGAPAAEDEEGAESEEGAEGGGEASPAVESATPAEEPTAPPQPRPVPQPAAVPAPQPGVARSTR